MKRILIIVALAAACCALPAQNRKQTTAKKARTTQTTKTRKTAQQQKTTTSAAKKGQKGKSRGNNASAQKKPVYTNASIKGLEKQRSQIQQKIKEQEQALKKNQADVSQRLQHLEALNTQIGESERNIEGIEKDIKGLNGNMQVLQSQLSTLQSQLKDRQRKYIRSLRSLAHRQTVQDKLMFIFSAKNFAQMYRRFRFVREYAQYQRQQGEMLKAKQRQVDAKHQQLSHVKGQKNVLLNKGVRQRQVLENQHTEQQQVVASLQSQQKTIQKVIAEQRQKDAALNAQIDRLVAIEVEKAHQRAVAEAKRKAAAAAAAKARAEALKKQREEALARERENQRRIEAARAHEAQLKEQARKAAAAEAAARQAREEAQRREAQAAQQRAAEAREAEAQRQKALAEQQAREAEAQRQAAERKAEADQERSRQEMQRAQHQAQEAQRYSASDRMMNGGFEANRGRLPMPITGNYKIVSRYGMHNVEGLNNVQLDNKGIKIKGNPGCQARAVYDGEVTSVFGFGGTRGVMVRHGIYISVYFNLSSVSVHSGQHVSARQILGTVGPGNILQFQLRKETATLNPEAWLGR
jgi:septal ring factor EnvC (AmiA/AmiB activator)